MTSLLVLAALAATPTLDPAAATTRVQIVSHGDLDLASAQGRTTLDRRIRLAAREVCGDASFFDLAGQHAVDRCRDATLTAARATAEARVAARTGQVRIAAIVR